jgi:hypothetical protein
VAKMLMTPLSLSKTYFHGLWSGSSLKTVLRL